MTVAAPHQLLLVLDVDQAVSVEVVSTLLPDRRASRQVLRLTDLGLVRQAPGTPRDQLNWRGVSTALASMVRKVGSARPDHGPFEIYVAGFGPLSVFFALGALLDPRGAHIFGLQPERDGPDAWTLLDLTRATSSEVAFDVSGIPTMPAESTGQVAVFLSTIATDIPRDQLRAVVQEQGKSLAAIVALAKARETITPDNVGGVVRHLRDAFVGVATSFPHREGLTVTIAGPSTFALAAGLALNPVQFLGEGRGVEIVEYVGGPYRPAMRLPLEVSAAVDVPQDAEAVLSRLSAFKPFNAGVLKLRDKLSAEHIFVPAGLHGGNADIGRRARATLQALRLPDEPMGDAFELNILDCTLTIGHGLLHALTHIQPDMLERLGQMFTLHEVVHADQGIESHNYRGIGRSGVVLEDVDFWADAFAIGTAALHEVARNGQVGQEQASRIVTTFIDAHIQAMRAFDRMEQGSATLHVMPERRLRRYLIWYLQRARARAVRTPDDIKAMLNERLFVELAPLRGHLDDRFDKVVESGLGSTTLAFSIGGRAKRVAALPENFAPTELVDAVRAFDEPRLERAMTFIASENRSLLTAWMP
jgi:hypothetical protein